MGAGECRRPCGALVYRYHYVKGRVCPRLNIFSTNEAFHARASFFRLKSTRVSEIINFQMPFNSYVK